MKTLNTENKTKKKDSFKKALLKKGMILTMAGALAFSMASLHKLGKFFFYQEYNKQHLEAPEAPQGSPVPLEALTKRQLYLTGRGAKGQPAGYDISGSSSARTAIAVKR